MDQREFSRAIQGLGTVFKWSRAVDCPCVPAFNEIYRPTCVRCLGEGFSYHNPMAREERHTTRDWTLVTLAFSDATTNPQIYKDLGDWVPGDATITVPGDTRVGFRDRFVAIEQEMVWTEKLVRASGSTVVVGKTGRTQSIQQQAMRYEPVRVLYVLDDTRSYWEGEDFILTDAVLEEPKKLQWLSGKGPAAGAIFGLNYVCRPVWLVDGMVHIAQHLRGPDKGIKSKSVLQNLPTTYKIRLDFLTRARGT